MHYAIAKIEEQKETMAYRVYMTDSMKVITGGQVRFWEWIHQNKEQEQQQQTQDERTGEQIVVDVVKGAGLKFKSTKGGEE